MDESQLPVVSAARLVKYPDICVAECPHCKAIIEFKHYHGNQTGVRCSDCDEAFLVSGIINE